ncbi:hypothetical protein MRX96_031609 [Rhipicephalus microplus]
MVKNGRWIPQKERLLARSRILKFIATPVIALSLVHWLFDVNELTKAVKMDSFPLPWRSVVNNCSEQGEVYFIKRGFPEDVITGGKREKMSAANSCPLIPPKLVGEIRINMDIPSLQVVEDEFPDVMPGGRFRPKECTSRHRVAILVPYRNRTEHLKIFTYNIHKVLSRQQIDYGVFVIEQGDSEEFNRAKLLNIGFVEATALYDYQCFIFHDVDMVPVDDRNVYACPEQPRHLSVNVNNKSTIFYHYFFRWGNCRYKGTDVARQRILQQVLGLGS